MPAALGPADREALDGLRGLAALIVVASHASNLGLHLIPGWSLSGIGKSGVYLFFVLSAFLLTQQWLQASREQVTDSRYLTGYLVRRFARIYPLYAAVLLVGWALAPKGLGVPMDGPAVWAHLSLREGRDVYWSIPVEFLYYLCIPPVALLLAWIHRPAVFAAAIALLIVGATLVFDPARTPLNSINLGYYLPIFFAGSAAAWLQVRRRPLSPVSGAAKGRPVLWVADAAALTGLVITVPSVLGGLGLNGGVDALHREYVFWGLVWALLLTGVVRDWLPTWKRVLRTSWLRACGHWCFGIYLLHMPALLAVNKLAPSFVAGGWIALGLTLVAAAAAHRWIELPFIRGGARVGRVPRGER